MTASGSVSSAMRGGDLQGGRERADVVAVDHVVALPAAMWSSPAPPFMPSSSRVPTNSWPVQLSMTSSAVSTIAALCRGLFATASRERSPSPAGGCSPHRGARQQRGRTRAAAVRHRSGGCSPPPAGGCSPPPAGGCSPPPAGGCSPPPAGGCSPPPAGGSFATASRGLFASRQPGAVRHRQPGAVRHAAFATAVGLSPPPAGGCSRPSAGAARHRQPGSHAAAAPRQSCCRHRRRVLSLCLVVLVLFVIVVAVTVTVVAIVGVAIVVVVAVAVSTAVVLVVVVVAVLAVLVGSFLTVVFFLVFLSRLRDGRRRPCPSSRTSLPVGVSVAFTLGFAAVDLPRSWSSRPCDDRSFALSFFDGFVDGRVRPCPCSHGHTSNGRRSYFLVLLRLLRRPAMNLLCMSLLVSASRRSTSYLVLSSRPR